MASYGKFCSCFWCLKVRTVTRILLHPVRANMARECWRALVPLLLLLSSARRTGAGAGGRAPRAAHSVARLCLRGGGAADAPAVTAYGVTGAVDYERLVRDWGSQVTGARVLPRIAVAAATDAAAAAAAPEARPRCARPGRCRVRAAPCLPTLLLAHAAPKRAPGGAQRINATLVERMERLTGRRAHHLIRRGFFFSHRDLDKVLDAYERGEPFYLYTGRGPSSQSLHVGHLVPFQLTQWLQAAFGVPVVIQITDDEKFLWKGADLEVYREFGLSNVRDILAVGFDPARTYVLIDTDQIAALYPNTLRIQRLVSVSVAKSVFGFDDSSNIGQLAFPALQIAPALSSSFPGLFPTCPDMWCLIPCAIDQVALHACVHGAARGAMSVVCACVYMHCVDVCMHALCICVYVCRCVCVYVCMCVCVYIFTCICVCVHMYAYTCTCVPM